MKKLGIVVGAAPLGKEKNRLKEIVKNDSNQEHYIIAADGGIRFFIDEEIEPDEWIGDMDSVDDELSATAKNIFPNLLINSCSPIKDDTDTAIALDIIFNNMGCDAALVFGGIGGTRIEHSMANIQLMHHYALNAKQVKIISENSEMYVLYNSSISYDKSERGFISVFSLSDNTDVEIKGLFYEYKGELKNSYALGVSNEFTGKEAYIKAQNGAVLIIKTL